MEYDAKLVREAFAAYREFVSSQKLSEPQLQSIYPDEEIHLGHLLEVWASHRAANQNLTSQVEGLQ